MNWRHLLFVMVVALGMVACSKDKIKEDPSKLAGATACQYYEYLLDGKFSAFVDGSYGAQSTRKEFRAELVENAKMFVGMLERKHQGLKDVEVLKSTADTTQHAANVILRLSFGDGTKEQVAVPMVEDEGLWYMR